MARRNEMLNMKRKSDGNKTTVLAASDDSISVKRKRLENSSAQKDAIQEFAASSDKDEISIKGDLRIGLILEKIYACCWQILIQSFYNLPPETTINDDDYSPSQLSHPRFIKFSRELRAWNCQKKWYDIASIDFYMHMPSLQVVELTIVEVELREIYLAQLRWQFDTVRTLRLELRTSEFNLGLLKYLFPNGSVLNLTLKNHPHKWPARNTKWTCAPVRAICRNWPGLEELKIEGPAACFSRNYDADFIGISPAELALLREQDDDYLNKVQIVPSRHSLLTLTKLRDLWLDQDLFANSDSLCTRQHPQGLVSWVAQLLGFNRNPQMNVCLRRW